MNKLDTALRLLKLLNERKVIDSRIVAEELHVSLRTAQRYLLDLSIMPCVIADEKNHTYQLTDDYALNKSLNGELEREQNRNAGALNARTVRPSDLLCLLCNANVQLTTYPLRTLTGSGRSARNLLLQLTELIRKNFGGAGCGFRRN